MTPDELPTVTVHRASWNGPEAPAGHLLLNAPRPLLGDSFQGPFLHGVHYTIIPADNVDLIDRNARDDAHLVRFVDNDDVRAIIDTRLAASGYTAEDTDGLTTADLAAMYDLPWHPEPEDP